MKRRLVYLVVDRAPVAQMLLIDDALVEEDDAEEDQVEEGEARAADGAPTSLPRM